MARCVQARGKRYIVIDLARHFLSTTRITAQPTALTITGASPALDLPSIEGEIVTVKVAGQAGVDREDQHHIARSECGDLAVQLSVGHCDHSVFLCERDDAGVRQ